MRPAKLFAGFGILFTLFLLCAPIASGQTSSSPTYYYCFTKPIDGTQYLAAVTWSSTSDPRPGFADFLVRTYSLQRNSDLVPICISELSLAVAQDTVDKNISAPAMLRSVQAKKVDTHWNPASSQGAAPSATAPAPAPPASSTGWYAYCSSDGDPTAVYFSDIFPVELPKEDPHSALGSSTQIVIHTVGNAFIASIKQTYSFKSNSNYPSQCPYFGNGAAGLREAQASKANLEAQYTGAKMHVVETGWKMASQQSAATPPAGPPAPSSTAAPAYVVCAASSQSKFSGYVSAVFPVTKTDDAAWASAFTQFLRQKYSMADLNFLGCDNTTLENAQLRKAQRVAGWRDRINVVETGWTYGNVASAPATRPATAPAAPTATAPTVQAAQTPAKPTAPSQPIPAAAAAPKVTYAVCHADFDQDIQYYSAVFDGTVGDYNVRMPAFRKFLEEKYHSTRRVRCTKLPSQADAQKYWDNQVNSARAMKLGDGSHTKVIETGWSYK